MILESVFVHEVSSNYYSVVVNNTTTDYTHLLHKPGCDMVRYWMNRQPYFHKPRVKVKPQKKPYAILFLDKNKEFIFTSILISN